MVLIYIAVFLFVYVCGVVACFLTLKNNQTLKSAWLKIVTVFPIFGFVLFLIYGHPYKSHNKFNPTKNNCLTKELCSSKTKIFKFGEDMFDDMFEEISCAKRKICISFYIFDNGVLGKKLLNLLCLKARLGCKVYLLYDSIGSHKARKSFFEHLTKSGGFVKAFQKSGFVGKFLNPSLNFRMHRKMTIIDEQICYVGGLNVRDDHVGLEKNVSPWRDTHFKFYGDELSAQIEKMFFYDFCFDTKKEL